MAPYWMTQLTNYTAVEILRQLCSQVNCSEFPVAIYRRTLGDKLVYITFKNSIPTSQPDSITKTVRLTLSREQ